MEKKLYKSSSDKVLAGVCGGIAEYFAVDTVIVRLAWVVFTLMGGAGLLAYIIAAIIVPEDPGYYESGSNDEPTRYKSPGTERKNSSGNTSIALGVILLLLGAFVLARDFIPWIPRDVILAAMLIGLGVFFLVRKK
jgi:phage shock protein C